MLSIGKTSVDEMMDLFTVYEKRLANFINFEAKYISGLKNKNNLTPNLIKDLEGTQLLSYLVSSDFVCLLDEEGKEYTSKSFSDFLETKMVSSVKRLVFVIGGAYGFSEEIYKRANSKICFSKMTFTHQMIRLFFIEQLYRSYTIINNLPYHNE